MEKHSNKNLVDIDDKPISKRDIQRGLRLDIFGGSLGIIWVIICLGMPLTMFMECLGASGVLIGMIVTLQHLSTSIQIPSSLYIERLRQRKRFWGVVMILSRTVWFVPVLVCLLIAGKDSIAPYVMLAVVATSALLLNAVSPSWYSWMADLVPDKTRGRFWGIRQSVTMIASLVSLIISGYILDLFPDPRTAGGTFHGFAIIFFIAAVVGTVDILIHFWVPEPKPSSTRQRTGLPVYRQILKPLKKRDFLFVTLAYGVWYFSLGMVGSFSFIYLSRAFNTTYTEMNMLIIAATIGIIVSGIFCGKLMDAIGCRIFGILMLMIMPFFGLSWFFLRDSQLVLSLPYVGQMTVLQPILVLGAANFFAAMFVSGFSICQVNLISVLVPKQNKTTAMAVHWTVIGCFGAVGPLVGGLVLDWFTRYPLDYTLITGSKLSFFHILVIMQMATIWLIVFPLFCRIKPGYGDPSLKLLVFNPFRTVGMLQNVINIGNALTASSRLQAVRNMAKHGVPIGISSLIRHLDDPSADVREEAAFALGQIRSSEAIDALLEKLEHPENDLKPQIARSLRYVRTEKTVEPLIRTLSEPDRETQSESARTLGTLGDDRAIPPLLQLLHDSNDAKVISASSEALSRLRSISAIYKMLPHMKSTTNPVLKRSLAVAIGDLLGTPDGFYRFQAKEETDPGKEINARFDKVKKVISKITGTKMRDEGQLLIDRIDRVDKNYDAEAWENASEELFSLAVGLAALQYGIKHGEEEEILVETLLWHNEQFGVGVWFLNMIRPGNPDAQFGSPEVSDIQIGIYFITEWIIRNWQDRSGRIEKKKANGSNHLSA